MTDDPVGTFAADNMHRPQLREPCKPTSDYSVHDNERWDQWRAKQAAQRAYAEPFRRAVLPLGPPLRDIEAAVHCRCSCHPQAPQMSTHAGGTDCLCQLTEQERRQVRQDLRKQLDEMSDLGIRQPSLADQLAEPATEMGVELRDLIEAAPFVISGLVDGTGFYLRERHGKWELVLATGDDPSVDIWQFPRTSPAVCVASGRDSDFYVDGVFSPERALRIAVDGVRIHRRRTVCNHPGARSFCPDCGQLMTQSH